VLEWARKNPWTSALLAFGVVVLALLPQMASSYTVQLCISIYANVALATAWAFFSGTTRYISLATAAFFGIGIYALAILQAPLPVPFTMAKIHLPLPVALAAAAVVGFLVALVVGLSTLRLRGVYFVVFTFGLTELIHQVINWWAIKNRAVTHYIFTDASRVQIYEALLAVSLFTIAVSWYVSRTRLGYALRAIGEDETVARHTGIDTTNVKVLCFAASAAVMALVGALLTLQFPYIDASIAFNNTWSFEILIAALLGGPGRPGGPALGAIPLVLLKDQLVGSLYFPVALGLCFVAVVYVLPGGVAPLIERAYHAFDAAELLRALRTGRLPDSWQWPHRLKLGVKAGLARFNGLWRL
jgi:branched-chain amino acid transport system permease protein